MFGFIDLARLNSVNHYGRHRSPMAATDRPTVAYRTGLQRSWTYFSFTASRTPSTLRDREPPPTPLRRRSPKVLGEVDAHFLETGEVVIGLNRSAQAAGAARPDIKLKACGFRPEPPISAIIPHAFASAAQPHHHRATPALLWASSGSVARSDAVGIRRRINCRSI